MKLLIYILFYILSINNLTFAAKYLSRNKNGVYKFIKADPIDEIYKAEPVGKIKYYGPLEKNRAVLQTIMGASKKYRVDSSLIMAVIKAESNFTSNAVSPAGAEGIMQIMPRTAMQYGVINTFDYRESIYGGTRYLRYLLNMFMGNVQLAVAGYNAGENAVFRFGTIPPYDETQNYVKKVMNFYNIYSYEKFKSLAEQKKLLQKKRRSVRIANKRFTGEKKKASENSRVKKVAKRSYKQAYNEEETKNRKNF